MDSGVIYKATSVAEKNNTQFGVAKTDNTGGRITFFALNYFWLSVYA